MKGNRDNGRHLSAVQKIAFGFLSLILIGAILLCTPLASADGTFTSPIDGLFTATTSVCVTGLTTVTTATHWSIFGKVIILMLIQLGGLGVVCASMGVLIIIRRKITMRERLLIQAAYNLDSIDGMVRLIRNVIKGAFVVEGMGAVFYAFAFVPEYGLAKGIWYSVFHSVSAFCNAGIDLIGDSSLYVYRDDILVNLVTIVLIISGGIGFIVWWDIKKVFVKAFKIRKIRGQIFSRLTVHSKLAITTTIICIITGMVIFFIIEYNNVETIGEMDAGHKVLTSLFQSVTTRTAGFATIPQESFRETSYIIIVVLMLIGGSPMGTAGGFKTTTLAMVFLSARSVLKGRKNTEVFKRKISSDNIRTAIAVLSIVMAISIVGVFILSAIEPFALKDIVFEVTSAMGTVGLTRGITPNLSTVGKLVICIVMFAGRIGPITLVMAFNSRKKSEKMTNMRELAETKILIG